MANKALVIVESPTKARTIAKFVDNNFIVKASNGHVRDLPNSAAEIPEKYKKSPWAKRLGVNVDADFEPLYVIPPSKQKNVQELKKALQSASILYLATDEDREGESISWHLVETLHPKIPIKRLVFHEITKEAIAAAFTSARNIDENLVKAQETRRIVDRLYGYEVSPVLWKKMATGLSAGRVQSVAIKLLVEREKERIRFRKAIFWDLKGTFGKLDSPSNPSQVFDAELTHVHKVRVATGKDFHPETGKLAPDSTVILLNEQDALTLKNQLDRETAVVSSVEEKPYVLKPSAPFVTSSLQQEANRKLRFSAKHTMSVAQQLYENGFITYMRTDSTTLSQQALQAARNLIQKEFGNNFLSAQPRVYTTKVKNAQEAHEAIRPAGDHFTEPEMVRTQLGTEAFKLYDMIWKRTIACQMADARGTHITVQIDYGPATFRASGKTVEFPGFLRAYVEGTDDSEAEGSTFEKFLPKLEQGEKLLTHKLDAVEHSTQPPARFTEGSLIKHLEQAGIGRPSTWATVVELVLNRSYAFKKGTALVPTFIAFTVVGLLDQYFSHLLDYEFTARLEDDLDAISRGEAHNITYLKEFYFGNGHPGLKSLVEQGEKTIDPRKVCGIMLGKDEHEKEIEVRLGRYGLFVTNGEQRVSIPETTVPDELTLDAALQLLVAGNQEPKQLGTHPNTSEIIYLKSGRFGPYVQLGEKTDDHKPKMASLLKGMPPEDVTLEYALKLLSMPRNLGEHPETKEPVIAASGRFGPYVQSGKETRSIPFKEFSVLEISLEQAVELLKRPKQQKRAPSLAEPLKELGLHPVTQSPIKLFNGRYGPYVSDTKINASLPKGTIPESLTFEEALTLLEARERKMKEDGLTTTKKFRKKKSFSKVPSSKKKEIAKSTKEKEGKPLSKKTIEAKATAEPRKVPKKKGSKQAVSTQQ